MALDKRGRKLPKGIRQRGSVFEGRVTYKGKTYTVHGSTVTETQKNLVDMKYKLSRGFVAENSRESFNEWFFTWLNEYRRFRIKIGTYETYKQYYKSLIRPHLGDFPLCDIRCTHIQRVFNDLYEKGYSLSTIKIVSVLIGGCLHQAVLNGMLDRSPADSVQLPRKNEPSHRSALTKEQQQVFTAYSDKSAYKSFFALLLRTGLRSGEIRGLKFSDVDFGKNVIHIRRTLKYLDGSGFFEDTPKTRASVRDIPITSDIMNILAEESLRSGSDSEKYIFRSKNEKPLSRDQVQSEIDRIVQKINEDGYEFGRITPHVFRHTFATRAIEAGMPPQVLKTILGHSSLSMTMDLYSHVMPETRAAEMEKIASAF